MDTSSSSTSNTRSSSKASSAIAGFLKLGFFGVMGFSGGHLLFCWIISWIIGHDFSTVVYVTAAATVVGALITFTFAFLIALNLVLTAASGFSQFGQMFGGGGGGSNNASPFAPGPGGQQRSRISEINTDSSNNDNEWFTMD